MTRSLRTIFLLLLLACAGCGLPVAAQNLPEVLEAIQRARVTTRILYVTAHPDDESSSVLTYLARGLGADVALLSITRGEGGQNALGPEQGAQLGILRTAELEAATKTYGVRLYFTRAPDFGYSKTPEETLKVWGTAAVEDMVHVLRTFRPHVIINHWGGVRTGHGQHQAAGILTPMAHAAVAGRKDEGTWLWDTTLLLNLGRGESAGGYAVRADQISPLWGKSYREIGLEGFANHRTQGIVGFRRSPFFRRPLYLGSPTSGEVDPKRLAWSLTDLALNRIHKEQLELADRSLAEARDAAQRLDWAAVTRSLAAAGRRVRSLLEQFKEGMSDSAEARLAGELEHVLPRIDAALVLAAGLRLEAQAERSELAAGESFSIQVEWQRRADVPVELNKPQLILPAGWIAAKEEREAENWARFTVTIPAKAKAPAMEDEWMHPWPAALVQARMSATVEGYGFEVKAAAMAEHATSTRVDALPLRLVPAVALTPEPKQFVVTTQRPPKPLELLVRIRHYGTKPAEIAATVETPPEWSVSPPQPLRFSGAEDQLVRFTVTPPAELKPFIFHELNPCARRDTEQFCISLEPLPTLPTRLWAERATTRLRVFDVAVPENLRVGYVAAENDPIPAALSQLGVHVELLDEVALAFSDLRRFDAIAIGIRAYELRDDVARANPRLLDYAAAGGTLLVQYQREYVWNTLKPAPYPAAIGEPSSRSSTQNPARAPASAPAPASPVMRITDENSPVRFLASDHPVLNFPNRISSEDFQGWVQERGLYFWGRFDPRYQPVLALRDPGEEETTGGLVYARVVKGIYIYTGLAFFRQLPEGVPGAYRLFINLLSQSRGLKQPR